MLDVFLTRLVVSNGAESKGVFTTGPLVPLEPGDEPPQAGSVFYLFIFPKCSPYRWPCEELSGVTREVDCKVLRGIMQLFPPRWSRRIRTCNFFEQIR